MCLKVKTLRPTITENTTFSEGRQEHSMFSVGLYANPAEWCLVLAVTGVSLTALVMPADLPLGNENVAPLYR